MAAAQFCRRKLVPHYRILHRSFCEAAATAVSRRESQALPRSVLDCWQARKIVTGEIFGPFEKRRINWEEFNESGCWSTIGHMFVSGPDHAPNVKFMRLSTHRPSTFNCNTTLEGICAGNNWECSDARPLLVPLLLKGFIPDLKTFTILIDLYCKQRNYQNAVNTALEMKAAGISPDDTFLSSTIHSLCTRIGPNLSYQLLKKLRRNQIQVPFSCYNMVADEFCERKMIQDAEIVRSDMCRLAGSSY